MLEKKTELTMVVRKTIVDLHLKLNHLVNFLMNPMSPESHF